MDPISPARLTPERAAPDRRWVTLAVTCFATYVVLVEGSIVNVALPSIVRQLGADTTALKWVVDAYNLAFAALVLVGGTLSDRFGRRRSLITGLVIFGVGNALGALAGSTELLIGARVVMGIGAALVFPTTLSIITNTFTDRSERAKAIGIWGAMTGIGVASGPVIGGWLLDSFYWGSVFVLIVGAVALALVAAVLFVPESADPSHPPIDGWGVLLSTAGLAALVIAIIQGPDWGWTSGRTLAGFAASLVFLAAFVVWERRCPHPMLEVAFFRNPRFSAASGAIALAFFALFGFIFLITQYFQFVRSYGAFESGLRTLPVALSIAVAAIGGTRVAVRFGNRLVVAAGLTLLGGSFAWIALVLTDTTPYSVIVGQMVMMGLGLGLTTAPATESIMGEVPKEKAGQGSAVNDATREVGGTLGVAVIGSAFSSVYIAAIAANAVWSAAPPELAARAEEGIGLALGVAEGAAAVVGPEIAAQLAEAARQAFMDGLVLGCVVAAAVALGGAVMVAVLLPTKPKGGEPVSAA
jgi:EmrB/QacA subfamily drug resistance transporter